MPTTTHKTILQIEADASKVARAGRTLEKALDPRAADRLNDILSKLDDTLSKVWSQQEKLLASTKKLADARTRLGATTGQAARAEERWGEASKQALGFAAASARFSHGRQQAAEGGTAAGGDAGASAPAGSRGGGWSRSAYAGAIAGMVARGVSGQTGIGGLGSLMSTMGAAVSPLGGGLGALAGIPLMAAGFGMQQAGQSVGAYMGYTGARAGATAGMPAGMVGGIRGAGAAYGLGPAAAVGQAGGFFAGIGGRGARGAAGFRVGLGMQHLGMQTQTVAALFRSQRAGRGGRAAQHETGDLAWTIREQARAAGLAGSEVNEFAAHMINAAQSAGAQGASMDYGSMMGTRSWLTGMGFQGLRASSVAGQFEQSARATGRAGPQSAFDIQMMRSAGWKGGGGAGYAKAMFAMQNPTAQLMGATVKGMFGGGRMGEKSEDERAFWIQRALGSKGVQIGEPEARAMARYAKGEGGEAAITQILLGGAGKIAGEAGERFGAVGGTILRKKAVLEGRRVNVGGEFAGLALEVEDLQIKMAELAKHGIPAMKMLMSAAQGAAGGLAYLAELLGDKKKDSEDGGRGWRFWPDSGGTVPADIFDKLRRRNQGGKN